MRDLDLGPQDCWIIEDSINGLRAARAAGCAAVAITTTFDAETLSAANPDMIVESFAKLRQLLEPQ